MKRYLKKCMSLVLVLSLLMGVTCIPAAAAESSAGTIYVAVETPTADVEQGTKFNVSLNFSNNPNNVDESLQAYLLLLAYDSSKVKAIKATNVEAGVNPTHGSFDSTLNLNSEGVVALGWASSYGVSQESEDSDFNIVYTPVSSGTLATVSFGALQNVSAQEISEMFRLVESCAGKNMSMTNGTKQDFDIVICPALSVDDITSGVYVNSTLEEVQNLISAKFIDASGTASAVNGSDLAISVKGSSVFQLSEGNNVLVAEYDGKTCEFNVTAEAVQVTDLKITTEPKLDYVSGDKLNLSAMVVKATYSHGNPDVNYKDYTTSIADGTALTVADYDGHTITVTDNSGSGETAETGKLTVNPKSVQVPEVDGTYTYSGSQQTLQLKNNPDAAYYDIIEGGSGTNAGTYTAKLKLKDTTETKWDDGGTADKSLSWTIAKADPKFQDFVFTASDNLVYDGSGKAATVKPASGIDGMGDITVKYDGSTTAPSTVGEHVVTIDVTEGANYTAATGVFSDKWRFVITKKIPNVTAPTAKTDLVYTGSSMALIEGGSAEGGEMQYRLGDSGTFTNQPPEATDAGTYTVWYQVIGDSNHENVKAQKVTVTIAKANYDMSAVTFDDASKVYNGSEQGLTVSGSELPTGADGKQVTVSYSEGQTDVGSKAITATFATESTNYNVPAPMTATLTVTAADMSDVSVAQSGTLTYDTTAQTPVVTTNATTVGNHPVTFTFGTTEGTYDILPAFTDAGSYTVYYKASAPNHTDVTGSFTVTVDKAGAKTGVALELPVYFGASGEQAITVSQFDAFQNEAGAAIKSIDEKADDKDIIKATTATGFTLTSGLTKDNVDNTATLNVVISSKNYADSTAEVTVKLVGKTAVTVTLADASVTYGTAYEPKATASATGFTPVANGYTYSYKVSTAADSTYTTEQPTDVGTYTVKVVYEDGQENNGVPGYYGTGFATLTINPLPVQLTWSANSLPYNGSKQTITAEVSNKVGNDTVTLTYSGNTETNVGSYTAEVTGLSNTNYTLGGGTNVTHKWSITANAPTATDFTFTAPANLEYNGSAKNASVAVNSGIAGMGDVTVKYAKNGTEVSEAKDAGTYTVSVSVAAGSNYAAADAVTADSWTFTITPKSISGATITLDKDSKEYTGAAQTFAVTVKDDSTTLTDADYTVSDNTATDVKADGYTLTVTGQGNYTGTATKLFNITAHNISDKTAYVTNSAAQKVVVGVGSFTEPAFKDTRATADKTIAGTVTYSEGATTNVTAAEMKTALAAKAKGATGTVSWEFTPSDSNYTGTLTGSFTYELVDIEFKVGAAPATFGSVFAGLKAAPVYGDTWSTILGTMTKPTASVNGTGDNGTGTYTVKVDGAACTLSAVPAVKDYTVTVFYSGTIGGKEYTDIQVAEATVTVAKAALTVTADNKSVTFGDAAPTYTVQYSGFVNGETASVLTGTPSFTCIYAKGSNVGTYDITPAGLTSGNYIITFNKGTLTVAPYDVQNATVTVEPTSLNYTGSEQSVAVTVKAGETTLISGTDYTVSGNAATEVGTHTITVTGKGNYTGTNDSTSWTMLKAAQTTELTISGTADKTYGDAPFIVTVGGGNGTGAYQLASSNTAVLTVAAGSAANAFTVTVVGAGTANLMLTRKGDNNYADLTTAKEATVTVAKADRGLTVDPASMKLVLGSLTAQITPTAADLDHSAVYTYSSDKPLVAVVNNSGLVTGQSNGAATVTVTVSGSNNYNEGTATVAVTVVTEPVSGLTVTGGGDGSKLTASIEGDTIKVSGIKTSDAAITVDFANKETDFSTRTADGKLEVLYNSQVVATYKVDTSAVVMKDPAVDLKNEEANCTNNAGAGADDSMSSTDTKAEGVTESAAEKLQEEAKKLVKDNVAKVEVSVTVDITATELTTTTFKLDITPKFVVTTKDESDATIETKAAETVPNSFFTTAVTVSVKLPSTLSRDNLVAKHALGGGKFEWLAVTINGDIASWQQSSFSEVTLVSDSRSAVIDFHKDSGATETTAFGASSIGSALPADTKSGATFSGWLIKKSDGSAIDGFAAAQTVLTDELLTALNGLTGLTAEPVFTQNYVPSYGGGSYTPTYSTSVDKTQNGTVTVSPSSAKSGTTVTITVKPDKGFELDTLKVTDKNGSNVKVTAGKDGKYTFEMPASKVTIKAAFVESKPAAVNPFTDVQESSYYYDAVLWAVKNGITGGTTATTFSPNATCTRAQAVTFLWRAAGSPAPKSGSHSFVDLKEGTYYYDAVLWAAENGITGGTTATTFSPNATCTRAQIVTFLWRAQKMPAAGTANSFTDVASNSYYADAVLWAAENGITGGTTATTFSPSNNCTRAQIVTFLFRCLGE